jgi:hypothetical protein
VDCFSGVRFFVSLLFHFVFLHWVVVSNGVPPSPSGLVSFPAHLMFSGGYGTVSAAVGVDSVLVFCDAIMRC